MKRNLRKVRNAKYYFCLAYSCEGSRCDNSTCSLI